MWQAIRENPRAVVYAVLMHLVLLALLMFSLDWTPKTSRTAGESRPIQAELIDQRRLEVVEERKREAEQAARQQAEQAARQKAEAEQKRQAELAAKQKAEAEAALQASIAAEQALLEEQRVQSALGEYIGYIAEKVERNWLRPAGSPKGLRCKVNVKVIPGGDVASARVIESSGDPVFDRSAENAVLRAAPLPMPKDPAIARHFRDFNFNFEPL
jgi:colicin import membrane protein